MKFQKYLFALILSMFAFVGTQAQTLAWPAGKAEFTTVTVSSTDSTARATIKNTLTVLDLGTLAKNATLHLDIPSKIRPGSMLLVKAASGAVAKNVTFGDYLQGVVLSGTINKGKFATFIYDGTKFFNIASIQYN